MSAPLESVYNPPRPIARATLAITVGDPRMADAVSMPSDPLAALQAAADQARARYDYTAAVDLYTQALEAARDESASGSPAFQLPTSDLRLLLCDLLLARARCHDRLNQAEAQLADLLEAQRLAEAAADVPRQARVLIDQMRPLAYTMHPDEALAAAERGLALARQAGERQLEVSALLAVAEYHGTGGDPQQAMALARQALDLSQALGDQPGLAAAAGRLATAEANSGQPQAAQEHVQQALAITRAIGDRHLEARALLTLNIIARDLAQRRAAGEQALALFKLLGDERRYMLSLNNLSLVYNALGLYHKARDYAARAVDLARRAGSPGAVLTFLESLGRVELQHPLAARRAFEEILVSAPAGDATPAYAHVGLGRVALAEGSLAEARAHFTAARAALAALNLPADVAHLDAWLGLTSLAEGDWPAADRLTGQALAEQNSLGTSGGEYMPQDIYWCRWQVLQAPSAPAAAARQVGPLLDQARQQILNFIASLSDAGLRRNYLNKIKINRELLQAWADHHAQPKRGRRPAAAKTPASKKTASKKTARASSAAPAANLQEQFKRLLDLGARMNELGDVDALPSFMLDELIELTGAERAALVLLDASGARRIAQSRGFEPDPTLNVSSAEPDPTQTVLETHRGLFDEAAATRLPLLRQPSSLSPLPLSSPLPLREGGSGGLGSDLGLRSLLLAPLD